MTTIVLEVPDNKTKFIFSLLKELPFTKIRSSIENEITHNSIPMEELLKEGYIASRDEDIAITNDFVYVDMEHWD
jgi:hypothetical protein